MLAQRLEVQLAIRLLPDVKRLRDELVPRKTAVPAVTVEIPLASRYDVLLPSGRAITLDEVPA